MNGSPTVFLIEDDQDERNALVTLFRSAAVPVEAFTTAEEFIGRFDPERPGCVVANVCLRAADGMDLQHRLKKLGSSLPFIGVAAFASVDESVRAMKGGAFDFMRRPLQPTAFLERVRNAIDIDRRDREESASRRGAEESLNRLTPREREVLKFLLEGKTSKEVARALGISARTVEGHRRVMMQKMRVSSTSNLILAVLRAQSL